MLVILLTGSAYPEITQIFNQEGALISTSKKKSVSDRTSGIARYSIPDGIELQKDVSYEFYPVFGKTFSEIVKSSEENGPFNKKEKRRYLSKNDWSIGWAYQFAFSYEIDEEDRTVHVSLEISDIDIRDYITITLPTLTDDTALNPVEKNMWKNYLLRLLEHEHDHVRIIRDSDSRNGVLNSLKEINYLIFDYDEGIDIEKTVERFLTEETERIGREWVKKIKARDDEYSKITENGRKHENGGAFFRNKKSD